MNWRWKHKIHRIKAIGSLKVKEPFANKVYLRVYDHGQGSLLHKWIDGIIFSLAEKLNQRNMQACRVQVKKYRDC